MRPRSSPTGLRCASRSEQTPLVVGCAHAAALVADVDLEVECHEVVSVRMLVLQVDPCTFVDNGRDPSFTRLSSPHETVKVNRVRYI